MDIVKQVLQTTRHCFVLTMTGIILVATDFKYAIIRFIDINLRQVNQQASVEVRKLRLCNAPEARAQNRRLYCQAK